MSDMGLDQLSDEELMLLLQQLETDPVARAVNDYGQGSDFLYDKYEPTSWKRAGDKNDLYGDFFRTTQTYMPDWVPGLYPEVEDPGQFVGYRSDVADLYRNNPAYSQIESAMGEGATFDEAVELVVASGEYEQFLPKTGSGAPDRIGFRNSAEQFVSERAREGRELDQYDAELKAYEDYVNPRTGESFAPNRMTPEEFQASLRQMEPTTGIDGTLNRVADNIMAQVNSNRQAIEERNRAATNVEQPQAAERENSIANRSRLNVDSPNYDGRGRDPRSVPQSYSGARSMSGYSRQLGPMPSKTTSQVPYRSTEQRNEMNQAYNSMASSVYQRAQAIKASQSAPSKADENRARLAAFYNALIYGE